MTHPTAQSTAQTTAGDEDERGAGRHPGQVGVVGALTMAEALPIIDAAAQVGVPVLLVGGSGIGKSTGLQTLAKARGKRCEVLDLSNFRPDDIGGIPAITGDELRMHALPWLKRIVSSDEPAMVVVEEINTAPEPTLAAFHRVLLEGWAGDTRLPDGTQFVAAMNPTRSSTGGRDLTAPMASRFLHLNIRADAHDWVNGLLSGWRTTPTKVTCRDTDDPALPAEQARVQAAVTSFILSAPHLLNDQPEDSVLAAQAWPSSRKWEWVTQVLPLLETEQQVAAALDGLVGRQAAAAFLTFRETLEVPDPYEVLRDPATFAWATESAERVHLMLSAALSATQMSMRAADGSPSTAEDGYTQLTALVVAALDAGRDDLVAAVASPYFLLAPTPAHRDRGVLTRLAPILSAAGLIR